MGHYDRDEHDDEVYADRVAQREKLAERLLQPVLDQLDAIRWPEGSGLMTTGADAVIQGKFIELRALIAYQRHRKP